MKAYPLNNLAGERFRSCLGFALALGITALRCLAGPTDGPNFLRDSCANSGGACAGCGTGMAIWSVSEPYMDLWLYDEPIGYNAGLGPRVSFKLAYKQREEMAGTPNNVFSCGPKWNFSWMSYFVATYGYSYEYPTMYLAGGGERGEDNPVSEYFKADGQTPEFYSQTHVSYSTDAGNHLLGYTVTYPNGAVDYYDYVITNAASNSVAYLSKQADPAGQTVSFIYGYVGTNLLLTNVIDGDGITNILTYTNTAFPSQITSVQDPFGRTAHLYYNSGGMLTNVTDPINISSTFTYTTDPSNFWITALTTPYGTTTFTYTQNTNLINGDYPSNAINLSVMVVDPEQLTNLYVYRDASYDIPYMYDPAFNYPNTTDSPYGGINTGYLYTRNSWHWGPAQIAYLSTTNMNTFTTNDYLLARQRHWSHQWNAGDFLGDQLEMEQTPSPSYGVFGQQTWYIYDEGLALFNDGFFPPLFDARVLPNGDTWCHWININTYGHITNDFEASLSGGGSTIYTRSNLYYYATNGIDLAQHVGPLGETETYTYDNNHHVTGMTNAIGVSSYAYDSFGRLTNATIPSGLTTTSIYPTNGTETNFVQQRIAVQTGATNSYTYASNLVATHTDERGLITTNTWDNLQRLTSTLFTNGTVQYFYNNLDLVETIDRLKYTNLWQYDADRRLITFVNALVKTNSYTYCGCGSLASATDALLTNTTTFIHDIAGRVTNIDYPDGSGFSLYYDALDRLTNVVDARNVSVTRWFTDDGMLYASSNYYGQVFYRQFDLEDRVTNSVDRNGVFVTNTYDLFSRLLTRGHPDGGVEHFVYMTNFIGPASYSDQLNQTTLYTYDAAGRKITETNALGNGTQYAYDAANDLTNLIDGNNNHTTWAYDQFGNVTNKIDATGTTILKYQYDADNRLINRWSLARTNTAYGYDKVGNLTNVTYGSDTHPLSFSYDADNRMISMTDGVGTTTFIYTPIGQLASVGGLWPSDTVKYGYSAQLRSTLDLQQPSAADWMQSYGYDNANRLQMITSPAGAFSYAYNPGLNGYIASSGLVSNVALPSGAYINDSYDSNGRMLMTTLYNSTNGAIDSTAYTNNMANQRISQVRGGNNWAAYTYDSTGQLLSDSAFEAVSGATRLNEQLKYVYDSAGNLITRTNNALAQNFYVNALNELTTNTSSGTLTVMGTTTSAATNVTVNSTTASNYADATFAAPGFSLSTTHFTATARDTNGRVSVNTVSVTLSNTVTFQYDGNGNLTNDGLRNFAYDDENQLIQAWVASQWMSKFIYDGKMRRRIRQELTWTNSAWIQTNAVYYIYDGNLVIQERNVYNVPTANYVRGLDLSGSLQGAGGIGGLLAWTNITTSQNAFYYSDGGGNVRTLINSSNAIVAKYIYDAFGNILSKSGSLADGNLYRFSGKETHLNSGLVYYLYRYYDPNLQRWINRDPIQERGGRNLYTFALNDPERFVDQYGLICWGTVMQGSLTTIGALGTMIGSATIAETGIGFAGLFFGATELGLGITTIASGFQDSGPVDTPTGTIPQGPIELLGAMSGNATTQQIGGYLDTGVSAVTKPSWGGPLSIVNTLVNAPPSAASVPVPVLTPTSVPNTGK